MKSTRVHAPTVAGLLAVLAGCGTGTVPAVPATTGGPTAPTTPAAAATVGTAPTPATAATAATASEGATRTPAVSIESACPIYSGEPLGDRLVARIQIARPGRDDAPWSVGVGAGAVWVANRRAAHGSVMKVDPETNTVVGTVDLTGKQRGGPVVGPAGVYVSTKGKVVRIDPQTLATTTLLDEGAETVGVADEDVWVTIRGEAVRLDGTTGEELARAQLGTADILSEIGFADGSVWVGADEAVWRLDPETAEVVAEIPVYLAGEVVVTDAAVWTTGGGVDNDPTEQGCSAVHRIDPNTNEVVAGVLARPPGSSSMATLDGEVWWRPSPRLLVHIDPATDRVVEAIAGLPAADATSMMAGGYGSLWVADWGGKLLRIDP